jgi:leukotriene-A4 hydrolase
MPRLDPHSYNDSTQPDVAELDWRARVDFTSRTLDAEALLTLRAPGEGPLDLDTRELRIARVTDEAGAALAHELHAADPILGARLRVELPPGTRAIRIAYQTAPAASALQWLTPEQTAGGREPFLFSQCQAIHARSVVPLQDTPRLRLRYRAELTVPARLTALMAASFVAREERGAEALVRFAMNEPIPPYLLAFAVGALVSRDLGPRSRVWAEPAIVERAAHEFAGVDAMLVAAERLFGPYPWGRFDLLTMPPAFPYGGMENPRLTFLTPMLLAGDRSLVNVVAHELAHSWTGNLVTNASAEHFWLNEGFTVFAERRILEELEGREAALLHVALGRRELERAIGDFRDRPALTRLRTRLDGVDPDEAFSVVPYEKGYLFLRALEDAVGRARFDDFLRAYLERYRFQSITSEDFTAFAAERLPGALERAGAAHFLDEAGVPAEAPVARSARLDALERLPPATPTDEQARALTPVEWQLYLDALPRPSEPAVLEELEARFQLTRSGNYEILIAWLSLAAESDFAPAIARVEQVLGEVGRMKALKPLYVALAKRPATRELAGRLFRRYRARYHPIAQQVIENILRQHQVATHEVNPVSLKRRPDGG